MRNTFFAIVCCLSLIGTAMADEHIKKTPKNKIDWNSAEHQLHMAGAYAVNITTYSLIRDNTKLSKTSSLLISTGTTILIGTVVDNVMNKASNGNTKSTIVGASTAILIPLVFDF